MVTLKIGYIKNWFLLHVVSYLYIENSMNNITYRSEPKIIKGSYPKSMLMTNQDPKVKINSN